MIDNTCVQHAVGRSPSPPHHHHHPLQPSKRINLLFPFFSPISPRATCKLHQEPLYPPPRHPLCPAPCALSFFVYPTSPSGYKSPVQCPTSMEGGFLKHESQNPRTSVAPSPYGYTYIDYPLCLDTFGSDLPFSACFVVPSGSMPWGWGWGVPLL